MQDYSAAAQVIVGDVMGRLLLFLMQRQMWLLFGGSLIPWAGHNLLEPAALAKPILTGPHLQEFLEISQNFIDAHAMIKVNDELELAQNLISLLMHQELREKLGVAALSIVEKNRGATKKY